MASSEEDERPAREPAGKRRKGARACNSCRKKKIRCDVMNIPDKRCSNCFACGIECVYAESSKKRGPKSYVESLEKRLESMEQLFRNLSSTSNIDLSDELLKSLPCRLNRALPAANPASPAWASDTEDGLETSDEETAAPSSLNESMMLIQHDPTHPRFLGKSAGVRFVNTAMHMKNNITGETHIFCGSPNMREHFWNPLPYEVAMFAEPEPIYSFPPPDLIADLVSLYFRHINVFMPLLHRPTFERGVREALYKRDHKFGAVLLLVCCLASTYSDDERVFLDGAGSGLSHRYSAGWKWFNQVQVVRRPLLAPPCLYDLQAYALAVAFLYWNSPHACWTMVGIGLRLAQDVGAHRRRMYGPVLTVEDELWKRACWTLIGLDRIICCCLGRPCALQDEDIDLDLPAECDDEYWEHCDPARAFRQPADTPSSASFFVYRLTLQRVISYAMRTIYSINKSKVVLGLVGLQSEQRIVAELDAALKQWFDSVPEHLRWDPKQEDPLFFRQSAVLYTEYYNIQILIHRPFIPTHKQPATMPFQSLAICTNAAHSTCDIIDAAARCNAIDALIGLAGPAFMASVVLLVNVWSGKRQGVDCDYAKIMADVRKCMGALSTCEQRYHSPGRMWDILKHLTSAVEQPSGGLYTFGRDPDAPKHGAAPPYQPLAPALSTPLSSEMRADHALHYDAAAEAELFGLNEDFGSMPTNPSASTSMDAPAVWYNEQPAEAPNRVELGRTVGLAESMLGLSRTAELAGTDPFAMSDELAAAFDSLDTIAMWHSAPSRWGDWWTAREDGQNQLPPA